MAAPTTWNGSSPLKIQYCQSYQRVNQIVVCTLVATKSELFQYVTRARGKIRWKQWKTIRMRSRRRSSNEGARGAVSTSGCRAGTLVGLPISQMVFAGSRRSIRMCRSSGKVRRMSTLSLQKTTSRSISPTRRKTQHSATIRAARRTASGGTRRYRWSGSTRGLSRGSTVSTTASTLTRPGR